MMISINRANKLKNDLVRNYMNAMENLRFSKLADKKIIHLKNDAIPTLEDYEETETGYLNDKCSLEEYIAFVEDMVHEADVLSDLIDQQTLKISMDEQNIKTEKYMGLRRLKEYLSSLLKNEQEREDKGTATGYVVNKCGEQVSFQYNTKTVETLYFDRDFVKQKLLEISEELDRYDTFKEAKDVEESIEYTPKYVYETVKDNLKVFLDEKQGKITA